jgi:NAD-dependent deacetylase
MWDNYDVKTVAFKDSWYKNHDLMIQFYNERRVQLGTVKPNSAHMGLVELEQWFDVQIITQNVDNLHERAGSSKVLHLHGELTKVRGFNNSSYIKDIGYSEMGLNDKSPNGDELRPHIVLFDEPVPEFDSAMKMVLDADIFIIIGTSLLVYPAAELINYVPYGIPIYLIDPSDVEIPGLRKIKVIKKKATAGMKSLINDLLKKLNKGGI